VFLFGTHSNHSLFYEAADFLNGHDHPADVMYKLPIARAVRSSLTTVRVAAATDDLAAARWYASSAYRRSRLEVRPGVHAPIKSVLVPAPISVVLVFHNFFLK
jgi:hypothetical protein